MCLKKNNLLIKKNLYFAIQFTTKFFIMKKTKIVFFLLVLMLPKMFSQVQKSPVGVQLYSFREQFKTDVSGTLKKIKDMGITQVELAGFYDLSAQDFKKKLDENGMKAAGISVEFEALEDEAKLAKVIADAKTVGADYLVCFWIPHAEGGFTLEETKRGITGFNKGGKMIADSKLMLLYHPHGYEFRPYKDEYLIDLLIKETSKYLNFEMDLNWVFHAGHNPVTWLNKYPTRWKALHIKDRVKGTACNQFGRMDVELNVPIGKGEVNIDDSVKAAQKIGVKYYFIEDESSRSLEQTPLSILYLRPFFR
jgi:sugar phosphate isomerase/epimerase